jgi:hypothetical protein
MFAVSLRCLRLGASASTVGGAKTQALREQAYVARRTLADQPPA